MEEKKQSNPTSPETTHEELKQNVDGEWSLEQLDRRVPSLPHEESEDAWT